MLTLGLADGEIAMIRKASGRSALIIAAGLLLCVSGPLRAAEGDGATAGASAQAESAGKPIALGKFTRHRSRGKHAMRTRKPGRVIARGYRRKGNDAALAAKAIDDKILDDKVLDDKAVPVTDTSPVVLPDNVANANAQWASPPTKPSATPAWPGVDPDVVAADQLNDLDRTLSQAPADAAPSGADPASQIATRVAAQSTPGDQRAPASQATMVSAMAAADRPQAVAGSSDNSAWGQSSLIGKIFIAIGGLLTAASAVRMFMA